MRFISIVTAVSALLAACEAQPKMNAPPMVRFGDDVVVTFDAPLENRPSNQYWIAIQRSDTPVSDTEGRVILERGDRRVVLRPLVPGDSEIRLHDGYPNKRDHLVARAPITVLYAADVEARGPSPE